VVGWLVECLLLSFLFGELNRFRSVRGSGVVVLWGETGETKHRITYQGAMRWNPIVAFCGFSPGL
jgi:hypothetical protein